MAPIGTCRLCEETGELRNSHILPRAAHLRTKAGSINVLIKSREKICLNNQSDFKEYLLCDNCEQSLSQVEKAAMDACKEAWLSRTEPYYQVPPASVQALVRFAYSVFWRSSVAKCVERYTLGGELESELRDAFHNRIIPDLPRLSLSLSFLKILDMPMTDRVLFTPMIARLAGQSQVHYFSILGLIFRLNVPDTVVELADEYFLRFHDSSGRIYPLQLWEQQMLDAELTFATVIAKRNRDYS